MIADEEELHAFLGDIDTPTEAALWVSFGAGGWYNEPWRIPWSSPSTPA